jgi:hypothetical protein
MSVDDVTRWEFTELQNRVNESMRGGGVAVIAVQVQQLAQDMAKHEERHDRQETARATGRRWMIGAVIAAVAAIDGPMVAVLLALHGH